MASKKRPQGKSSHRCPTCGSSRMRSIVGDFRTSIQGQPVVVPDLERDQCPDCGEVLFSPAAMRRMESYRKVAANAAGT